MQDRAGDGPREISVAGAHSKSTAPSKFNRHDWGIPTAGGQITTMSADCQGCSESSTRMSDRHRCRPLELVPACAWLCRRRPALPPVRVVLGLCLRVFRQLYGDSAAAGRRRFLAGLPSSPISSAIPCCRGCRNNWDGNACSGSRPSHCRIGLAGALKWACPS